MKIHRFENLRRRGVSVFSLVTMGIVRLALVFCWLVAWGWVLLVLWVGLWWVGVVVVACWAAVVGSFWGPGFFFQDRGGQGAGVVCLWGRWGLEVPEVVER